METTVAVTVKVTHTIDRDQLESLLIGAFEGGSNYWIKRVEPLRSGRRDLYDAAFDGGLRIRVSAERGDPRSNTTHLLDMAAMARGLQLMADHWSNYMADIISKNDDATTADVFLQLCLFGDVIYG